MEEEMEEEGEGDGETLDSNDVWYFGNFPTNATPCPLLLLKVMWIYWP